MRKSIKYRRYTHTRYKEVSAVVGTQCLERRGLKSTQANRERKGEMDSTATVWPGARPYDDYRGLDYYRQSLGPVTGHPAHDVAGAGAVTSAWSTVPPSSLAGAGLEERQHEDTVS